jgi:moderate conductance mechanosensitive channel
LLGQIVLCADLAFAENAAPAAQTAPASPDKKAEIIQILRDPQAREQLIQQLENASQNQQPPPAPPAPAKPATPPAGNHAVKILEKLSLSINAFQFGAAEILEEAHRGEEIYQHFVSRLLNVHTRNVWLLVLLKCMAVILVSYAVFFYTRYITRKLSDWFSRVGSKWLSMKIVNLLFLLLLNLLPIAFFAILAYFSLIMLHVGDRLQWILLAWISAFVVVKALETLFKFLFEVATLFPKLFALPVSLVVYFQKWLATLTALIIYGYLIIQVALFLGATPNIYEILLKLWGFLIVIALITFILNTPLRVVKLLENRKGRTDPITMGLERIARIELTIRAAAVVYLLLLYMVWIIREDHFFWFVVKGTLLSLILLYFGIKIAQIIHSYLSRDFSVSKSLKKRLPGVEKRFRRYRRVLDIVLRAAIYIAIALIILKIWSGKEIVWLPPGMKEILLVKMISVACITLAAMLIWEISNSLVELSLTKSGNLTLETGRAHTLLTVARKTIFITLSLIAFLMILSEFGMNIGPLLAGAGVLGLAISFGSQKLMQDLITGFFMLMENQIAMGDVIKIGDSTGTVEAISVRTVSFRDTAGVVHIIPYSAIVSVSNLTKEFSYYLFEIGVAYRENVEEVIVVLRKIARDLQHDANYTGFILEPLEVLGLDKFADSAVIIKARFKTRPGMQWVVGREFNLRMKQKFDELDIQIPFPHTVVFFGENKDGSSPAAHLQVKLENNVNSSI